MGAQASSGRRGRGGITGINITPMVDVMLVLLVILMVSANWMVAQSIRVELPKTGSSDGGVASLAAVTLTREGTTHFNGEEVTEDVLRQRLADAAGTPDTSLVVSADERVEHGRVMRVIDLARQAGIANFAVNVEVVE